MTKRRAETDARVLGATRDYHHDRRYGRLALEEALLYRAQYAI